MVSVSRDNTPRVLPPFAPKVMPLYLLSVLVFYFDFSISFLGLLFILYACGLSLLQILKISSDSYVVPLNFILALLGMLLVFGITMPALYYPVLLNALVSYAFMSSLGRDLSLIEIIAVRSEGRALSLDETLYCRRLTILWSLFMLVLTGVSFLTALKGDLQLWSLFNGLISYVLIVSLLIGEYFFRVFYKARFT